MMVLFAVEWNDCPLDAAPIMCDQQKNNSPACHIRAAPGVMAGQPHDRRIAMTIETAIFEQMRPRLTAISRRIVGSEAEAEDIVQDCFLKWQSMEKTTWRRPPRG
jgi:hypothetical protein